MPPTVVLFGTADQGKPRNRLMQAAVRTLGWTVIDCQATVWAGVEDKSTLGPRRMVGRLWGLLTAYPRLLLRYSRLPRHDVVMIGYPGVLDVLMLWPLARWRGVPIIWDVFISLYDTVVRDRGMMSHRNPLAIALYGLEWLAIRCADHLIMDTRAHAALLSDLFNCPASRCSAVPVGAELAAFPRQPARPEVTDGNRIRVLFYGQLIPLHGLSTILAAIDHDNSGRIDWHIIGTGQERPLIEQFVADHPEARLTWDQWVDYPALINAIGAADVCLGIFGASAKAASVIPNKAYQVLAAGRPLVTRDSAAIHELIGDSAAGVRLVATNDPQALRAAIVDLAQSGETPSADLVAQFDASALATRLGQIVSSVTARSNGAKSRF